MATGGTRRYLDKNRGRWRAGEVCEIIDGAMKLEKNRESDVFTAQGYDSL